jgi:hypothetical protein
VGDTRVDEPTVLQVALLQFGLCLKDTFDGLIRNGVGLEHLNGFVRVIQVSVGGGNLGRGTAR